MSALERLLELLPYLEKEMLALPRLVSRGDVCVDVGAAGGTYSLALSALVGRRGRVYAFEPRPRSHRLLRSLLPLPNLQIHPYALGEAPGSQTMLVPRRKHVPFSTRSFLRRDLESPMRDYYPEFDDWREIEVRTVTLDGFLEAQGVGRLDLLKCDVEGAEPWVLRGAEQTIRRHRPVVICEVEDRHLTKYGFGPGDVFGWLEERDYRPHVFREGALQPVRGPVPEENDYLFLPR